MLLINFIVLVSINELCSRNLLAMVGPAVDENAVGPLLDLIYDDEFGLKHDEHEIKMLVFKEKDKTVRVVFFLQEGIPQGLVEKPSELASVAL